MERKEESMRSFKRILTLALSAALSLSLCTGALAAEKEPSSATDPRFEAAIQAAQNGFLMVGYGNGNFGGKDIISRAMWVTVLENLCGTSAATSASAPKFHDVAPSDWYYNGVMWAVEQGIAVGYDDGGFHPNDKLDRQALAVMAFQCAQAMGFPSKPDTSVSLSAYTDGGSVADWAQRAYRWCLANGVLLPDHGNTLAPGTKITRAEAANASVALLKLYVNNKNSTEIAYSKLGYAVTNAVEVTDGIVAVRAVTADGLTTLYTKPLDSHSLELLCGPEAGIASGGSGGAVVADCFFEICYNAQGDVVTIDKMFKLTAADCWFDSMKYGVEFAPVNHEAGKMVAAGWVLDKDGQSILVGDTNHFEESYQMADNAKVYNLNTETHSISESSLDQMPVTGKTRGHYSLTPNRQMAIVIFDSNYKNADRAKVSEIYYLTPQTKVEEKYLLEQYDTMALYSCYPDTETGGVLEKPSTRPWLAYTKPFTIVENKMHYVGDNDVACYLFETDSGLLLLDFGWTDTGYIYYQNIEDMGFDPREVKTMILTHGHGDHYGQAADFDRMLKSAGNDPLIYESYEDCNDMGTYGFSEIKGALADIEVLDIIDEWYPWEQWMDFGGVRMYAILTPGHTVGCGSFIFEVTQEDGTPLTFGYQGGLGTVHDPSRGYLRHAFTYGLRFLQQNVDVDYSLPQHMAHFPLLEINKASEEKGITLLEALVPGNDPWCNFLERRQTIQEMQRYHDSFAADNHITVTVGGEEKVFETQKAAPKMISNEAGGPWKREAGEYQVTFVQDGIRLLHGFDVVENVNPLLDGIYNDKGQNLGDGFMITRDGYVHDPDQWFLQISMHVNDDYQGKFSDLTDATNGPIESVHGDHWYEIIRTEYFDSKEDAERVMAALKDGGTYTVTMDKNSNILLAEDIMDTFR